jgi:hypothetical protein
MTKFVKTEIENPATVERITAHYMTPSRLIEREKQFTDVATFHRWERYAEGKGYTVSCIDIERPIPPSTMPKETKQEDLPALENGNKWVRNMMTQVWVQEDKNTSYACSVASESYWCS